MPVGETLVSRGLITAEQLSEATCTRALPNERVDQTLVRLGLVTERDMLEIYSEQFAIPIIELTENEVDPSC
jgi:hypothetical protein